MNEKKYFAEFNVTINLFHQLHQRLTRIMFKQKSYYLEIIFFRIRMGRVDARVF